MSDDSEESSESGAGQESATGAAANPRYDAIALKAYFIALDRHARGEPADPLKDWLEAERQFDSKCE